MINHFRLLESGQYADVRFIVHGVELLAHKCVLVARSDYFYEMFSSRWRFRDVVHLRHPLVNPDAFRAVLSYLYTGQLSLLFSLSITKVLQFNSIEKF